MIIKHDFYDLFEKFIKDTHTGKRLKQNGQRVNESTIRNYYNTLRLLKAFELKKKFPLTLYELRGNNKRDFNMAKRYSNLFYTKFCNYLFDDLKVLNNYVGQNIKIIRSFYNWCIYEKGINSGFFHKKFYALHEEPPILTLSIDQLNFLIFNEAFNQQLNPHLQKAKDIFIIGCVTALRISDIKRLRQHHIIRRDGATYLNITSQKTGYESLIKLPGFATAILEKYKCKQKLLLPVPILCRFNLRIKEICALAGWTWPVSKQRKKGSKTIELKPPGNKPYRFCDLVSSHTMRRTCITNMLISGMPEHIVKKISGHTTDSKSFYRYVEIAQKVADNEIDKIHSMLKRSEKNT
ncbi:tyrosine-type recombinase/integrase [Parafilimonas terrae]|uniref:Phage integrase family protein n=1 Tax=Parafilimonas terrae TaxID=1465490 RepID=A0A1I5T9Z9_9BACT|nr:tyrosine-type recombinase/integrase [Parafilimonas terrae]SFP79798.1 Phage integrase family protein [Parafilimonas terrae]